MESTSFYRPVALHAWTWQTPSPAVKFSIDRHRLGRRVANTDLQPPLAPPDPSALRALLDALRAALPSTDLAAPQVAPASIDHPRIVANLRAILVALGTRGTPTLPPASASSAALFARDRIAAMRTFLQSFPSTWRRRVLTALGRQRATVLRTLLDTPVPDFLGITELSLHENANSAVLRWLLDPRTAPTIARPALLTLTRQLDDPPAWERELTKAIRSDALAVRREYTIAREWTAEHRLDRIDLVVSSPTLLLAIENKVWAREHDEQTRSYWQWLEQLPVLRAGIFLSPAGLPAASEAFRPMSYLDLLGCLLEGPTQGTPTPEEHFVLASYVKTLAAGILRAELRAIRNWEGEDECS